MATTEPARPTPRIPWCEPLDGFRAICACLAVIGHTFLASSFMPFDGALLVMGILVALFFAISAFVLYQPFIAADVLGNPTPDAKTFYIRRLLRVYPLFFIALTAYLILLPGLRPDNWWGYTRLYLFLQIFGEELNDLKGLPSAWYLCNEVIFYFLMPLMAWAGSWWSKRKGYTSVADRLRPHLFIGWAMVVIGPITRSLLYVFDVPAPTALPLSHLEFFGFGVVVAGYAVGMRNGIAPPRLFLRLRNDTTTSYVLFLVPVLLLVTLSSVEGNGTGAWAPGDVQDQLRFPLYFVAIVLLMTAAGLGRSTDPQNAFLGSSRFKWLSGLALHIYLWHQLVLGLMNRALGGLDKVDIGSRFTSGLWLCILALAGTVLLSWVSLPVTDYLYHRYRRLHGASSGASVAAGPDQRTQTEAIGS